MASLSLKVLGAMGLASYAAAYLCVKLRGVSYSRYKLIAVAASDLPQMPPGYSYGVLDSAALGDTDIGLDPQAIASRFAVGLQCLVVFDRKGDVAGVAWVGKGAYYENQLQVRFIVPADAAWDTGLWVPEDKRMGRAFAAIWATIRQWLEHESLDWTISTIADYNIPSILAHRRLGARNLGYVTVLRIGRLHFTFGARPLVSIRGRSGPPTARPRVPAKAVQALAQSALSA